MRNEDLWKATKQESAEILLKRTRWTWIGNTLRRSSEVSREESSNGTNKDKGEQPGPRTHGDRSGAGDEGGTLHGAQWRQQLKTARNGGSSLVASLAYASL